MDTDPLRRFVCVPQHLPSEAPGTTHVTMAAIHGIKGPTPPRLTRDRIWSTNSVQSEHSVRSARSNRSVSTELSQVSNVSTSGAAMLWQLAARASGGLSLRSVHTRTYLSPSTSRRGSRKIEGMNSN